MAKYELLQIVCGKEILLYESDKAYEIKRRYDPDKYLRIRIDGKMLLIFQAFDWVQGRPIREYKVRTVSRKPTGHNGNCKPVHLVNNYGVILKRFPSVTAAQMEYGYGSTQDITDSCNYGLCTCGGQLFQWAKERKK